MRGPSAHITDCVDDYKMRLAVLTLALLATLVAHSEATHCGFFEFDCNDGFNNCYSSSDRCDGIRDCVNGADESGCSGSCPFGISCGSFSSQCYSSSDICDGVDDCTNGADEDFCDLAEVVNNIVGIAVGVSVAAFVLFIVIPIAICVIVCCCIGGCAGAAASSSRNRPVTTQPAAVVVQPQYTAQPVAPYPAYTQMQEPKPGAPQYAPQQGYPPQQAYPPPPQQQQEAGYPPPEKTGPPPAY